ncbi:hypothetical protein, partial [Pseudomonas alvandae]|uniref:hypothetical protein n=1 Tax=Pseudomonas canavaninivorans TaxID=2842348 RepID=UPI002B1DE7C1
VVQASGPVDSNVRRIRRELPRSSERRAGVHSVEVVHVRKYRAIFAAVEPVEQVGDFALILRSYSTFSRKNRRLKKERRQWGGLR